MEFVCLCSNRMFILFERGKHAAAFPGIAQMNHGN